MAELVIDNTIEAIVLPNGEELELGEAPTLQSKTLNVSSAGTTTVTPDSGYDGLDEVEVSVPTASAFETDIFDETYVTENNKRKWKFKTGAVAFNKGWTPNGRMTDNTYFGYEAVAANTTVTPTTSAQTIGAADTMLEGAVTVDAIPSQYIIPSGTKSITSNGTGIDVTQYAAVDVAVPSSTPTLQSKSVSITPSETAQSQTVTPDSGYDGLDEVSVSVGAISSTYVGSGITRRSSTDLTVSGATVSMPSGYYENNASKAVASGTEGTPTATKGTVSNHAISVTPSVTNSAGYISGGTHTGTAVSVSASELVSGSETKTANGTYDVTNLASLVVAIPLQTIYTGTSAPSSSTGTNGDVYIQTA